MIAKCPNCSAGVKYEDRHAGKKVACPKCKSPMDLPPLVPDDCLTLVPPAEDEFNFVANSSSTTSRNKKKDEEFTAKDALVLFGCILPVGLVLLLVCGGFVSAFFGGGKSKEPEEQQVAQTSDPDVSDQSDNSSDDEVSDSDDNDEPHDDDWMIRNLARGALMPTMRKAWPNPDRQPTTEERHKMVEVFAKTTPEDFSARMREVLRTFDNPILTDFQHLLEIEPSEIRSVSSEVDGQEHKGRIVRYGSPRAKVVLIYIENPETKQFLLTQVTIDGDELSSVGLMKSAVLNNN